LPCSGLEENTLTCRNGRFIGSSMHAFAGAAP
jgi:hypothetical protein